MVLDISGIKGERSRVGDKRCNFCVFTNLGKGRWKCRLGFRVRISFVLMGCRKASIMVYGSDLALGLNKSKVAREVSRLSLLAFICQARSRVPEQVGYRKSPRSSP